MARAWSPEEVEMLLQLCGDVPSAMLCGLYNSWASKRGYPGRTARAVALKAEKCGAKFTAVGAWVTTGGLAGILGLPASTVGGWTKRYPDLPCKRFGVQQVRYINRRQFCQWAMDHLRLLGGIEHSRLVMLFEDENLATRITDAYPNRPAGLEESRRPVRSLDDGRVWPSIMAAAKEVHVSHSALCRALLERRPVAGMRFERAALPALKKDQAFGTVSG